MLYIYTFTFICQTFYLIKENLIYFIRSKFPFKPISYYCAFILWFRNPVAGII